MPIVAERVSENDYTRPFLGFSRTIDTEQKKYTRLSLLWKTLENQKSEMTHARVRKK